VNKEAQRKLWRPAKTWVPSEWAAMKEAWQRVYASLSKDIAVTRRDVKADLRAGHLVGAARVFAPNGTERCIIFEPEFWEPVEIAYAWSVSGWQEHAGEGEAWHFFVRRRELDKRYPDAANATSSDRPADSMAPPPRRRGPVLTHDWFSICGEIARRCIDPKTGRVQVAEKENALAEDVRSWLEGYGKAKPAPSEVREAVKRICAVLKSSQK
jgi:hypothetical protein